MKSYHRVLRDTEKKDRQREESYVIFSTETVPSPLKVWGDFSNAATEDGSYTNPYNTVIEAITAVASGGIVNLKGDTADSTTAEILTLDKAMTLNAINGTVSLGN